MQKFSWSSTPAPSGDSVRAGATAPTVGAASSPTASADIESILFPRAESVDVVATTRRDARRAQRAQENVISESAFSEVPAPAASAIEILMADTSLASSSDAAQPLTRRARRSAEAPAARSARATSPRTTSPRTTSSRSNRRFGRASAVPLAAASRPSGAPSRVSVSTAAKRSTIRHRVVSQLASVGAMAGVALILVATTVPANAILRPESAATAEATSSVSRSIAGSTQGMTVAGAETTPVTRDAYTVVSAQQRVQALSGNRAFLYTNNPLGSIQWPFPTGVPITSGFGPRRVAGCGFCSTYHRGLDFNPGAGFPIQSVTAGVVSFVSVSNSGLGNHVIVDHVVNGQKVQSVYAHMKYGSIKVAQGQQIAVGQQIGAVGSTGASTGAHLHFELRLDGVPVDPFAWLQANAN